MSHGKISYSSLQDVLQDELRTVPFLQRVGVLAMCQICPKCGEHMIQTYNNKHKWHWACNRRKNGVACKVNFSMKSGTLFSNSRLTFKFLLLIIWHFVHHLSQKQTKQHMDIGKNDLTIGVWCYRNRAVCNA